MKGKWEWVVTAGFAAVMAVFLTVPAFAGIDRESGGQWMHDDKGYWFKREDGSYTTSDWLQIGHLKYYFDEDGYVLSDDITPDGWQVDYFGARIDENNPGTAGIMEKTDSYDPEYPLKGRLEEFGLSLTPEYGTDSSGRQRWAYDFDSGVVYGSWDEGAHRLADDSLEAGRVPVGDLAWTADDLYSVYNAHLEPEVIAILAGLPVDETDASIPLGGTLKDQEEDEYMRVPRGDIWKAEAGEVRRFLNSFDWQHATDMEKAVQAARWVARASYHTDTQNTSDSCPYGPLVLRRTTCGGASYTFQLLTRCMGMECMTAEGVRHGGPHGWNLINIDGKLWEYDGTMVLNNRFEPYLFEEERYMVDDAYMDWWQASVPQNLYFR